jgi:hypothetical protein
MRELGGPRTVDHPVKHADQGFERFGIPNTREVHGRRRVGQSLLPRASIKRIERPKKGEAMSCAANAGKLLIDPTLSQMPPDVAMPKMLAGRVDLVHHPPSALFPGATGACRLLKQRILTGNCGRVNREDRGHDAISRSVVPPAGWRSLTPAASPPRVTHADPRSAGYRLLSRAQHRSGAPVQMFYFEPRRLAPGTTSPAGARSDALLATIMIPGQVDHPPRLPQCCSTVARSSSMSNGFER